MGNKLLAAVIGISDFDVLEHAFNGNTDVELLSPFSSINDLLTVPTLNVVDIIFYNFEKFIEESSGLNNLIKDKYVVFFSSSFDPKKARTALQAGANDFIVIPPDKNELEEIVDRAKIHESDLSRNNMLNNYNTGRRQPGHVITFFSTKGGAGKSVLSANFAVALSKFCGCRVCLIDLSLQFGDISLILDLNPQNTIYDLQKENILQHDDLIDNISEYKDNLYIISAPRKPEEAELIKQDYVRDLTEKLKDIFDYIIIDTSASFNDISIAALDNSDHIFLVVTPIIISVKNLIGSIDVMTNSLRYTKQKFNIVLNRSDSKSGISRSDIQKLIGKNIDYFIPSDGNILVPSINEGKPAVSQMQKSKFSKAVIKMAESFSGIKVNHRNHKSLFSKWLLTKTDERRP